MKKTLLAAILVATFTAGAAEARDQIRAVGSSTVFPFATLAAESWVRSTGYKSPVIESTGSGGGMKLFCNGVGTEHPDITNASRAIKQSEIDRCKENGVTPVELKIGFDGIVVASSKEGTDLDVTLEQLFLALASEVPDGNGGWKANPYQNWNEIGEGLPKQKIRVLGPPPTSGTRDAWVEIVMHGACEKLGVDKKDIKAHCSAMRQDGAFIESGENDNLIVQKLKADPESYGIFGYSFLEENFDTVKGATVSGVQPEFELIASGEYPISRSMYVYFKKEHFNVITGLTEFARYFASDTFLGEEGAAVDKGLIPLPASELKAAREKLEAAF